VVEALLNNSMTELVISLEFTRKNKFKKKRLKRPIYVRNIDSTSNYEEPIEYMVEVEFFFKEHKERTSINVIGGQKWSVIFVKIKEYGLSFFHFLSHFIFLSSYFSFFYF